MLLTIVNLVIAQTRDFSFSSNVLKEGFTITTKTDTVLRIRHSLKQMSLKPFIDNGYLGEQIEISGVFLPADEGKPNLPTNSRFIAIPNGATVNMNINNSQFQTITNVDLMAAAPIRARNDDTPATYEKDSIVYNTNSFYPENPVVISEVRNLRGVQTVILSVTPFQYNPITKTLKVYYDLEISLYFNGIDNHFGEDRYRSPYFDPILQQFLLNYDQLPIIDYETRMREWVSNRPIGCEYLIVIPNNEEFRPSAQELAEYRIKQGILTEVISLSEMGCANTSQMKNYFHNAFNNWDIPPVAVLLFGDHNENMSLGIPSETIPWPQPLSGAYISDNGYSDINGDHLPEICFSRLVARNATEAQMMVQKTRDYEYNHPNMEASTYLNPITTMGWQTDRWFQLSSEIVGGYWRNQGKTPIRINSVCEDTPPLFNVWSTEQNTPIITNYFGPNGLSYIPTSPYELGGWTGGDAQQIIDAINDGAFILLHCDHGIETGWETPEFNTNHVSSLTNANKMTFVICNDCSTGMFDFDTEDCLVESFMRKTCNNQSAGTVGCIAPTNLTFSFVSDVFLWGIMDLFDPNFLPDYGPYADYCGYWMPSFGNIAGKLFMQQSNWPNAAYPYLNLKNYTCQVYTSHGDAFLRLFANQPQYIEVEHPSHICMDERAIRIKAPAGAVVALTMNNRILTVTTATGNYQTIEFDASSTNPIIDIVVTKQDCIRYESQIFRTDSCLSGPSEIDDQLYCDGYFYCLDYTIPEIYDYTWSCSPNLSIVSNDLNKVLVRPNGIGSAYIKTIVKYNNIILHEYEKSIQIAPQYSTISTTQIISDVTWAANNYYLAGNVFVEPGVTLTVTGTVYCSEQACIKVKPDGKLVIDGGHLLSLCDGEQWEGIQVWGNRNKHQLKENGHYWQGIADLKNNAIIENAKIAINLCNTSAQDPSITTGGIVLASNSSFINNAKAVHFEPYENKYQHPQHPEQIVVRDNVSCFVDCLFEVNRNYVGPNEFKCHVGFNGVRGVKIKACDFRLEENPYNNQWPMGIHGYDSGFIIDGSYNNDTNGSASIKKPSSFDNFYKAVVATKTNSLGTRSFTVKATNFTNNQYGVFALNSGFGTVLNSYFEVGQRRYACPAGIYAEATPYFIIEQDTFTMAEVHPEEYYGIIIKNSKSVNQIYKNVFTNLYCGNVAVDVNNIDHILGLTYRCNENYENKCDIYISSENITTIGNNGIQKNQGGVGETANNTFSQPNAGNNPKHILNYGDYRIHYYYDSSQNNAVPSNTYYVTIDQVPDTVGCPSHYTFNINEIDTLNPVLPQPKRQQLENEYHEAYSIYNTLKLIYDSKIDGGNTISTIANIDNAQPGDMWTLRAQLLGLSPYISHDALTSAADRDDVFSAAVLFEILAANPEELKEISLIKYLQEKENPLPDYMIGILQQIAEGASSRSALESQMAKYKHDYVLSAGDIVRSLLSDTVVNLTELREWLGNMNDINADHDIISIYMDEGNFTDAMALANMLPSLYGLTGNDLLDHNDYMDLLMLYQTLYLSGRTTLQLTDSEKELVEVIADNGFGATSVMAKSILESVYGITDFSCPRVDLSDVNRGSAFSCSSGDLSKAMGMTCSTSPNPATTWVNVDFALPSDADRATLIVSNALGIQVAKFDLIGNNGQKVLDLRAFANGVYTCTLVCGKYHCTNKLVITK